EVLDDRGHGDVHTGPEDIGVPNWLELQLLVDHRLQPPLAIRRDGLDDPFEQAPAKALGSVDLPDLFALGFGRAFDFRQLSSALSLVVVALGYRGRVPDRTHGDRLCDGCGKSGDEQDRRRSVRGNHAQDDPEDVDQPVLAAKDHVAEPIRPAMLLAMRAGACPLAGWRIPADSCPRTSAGRLLADGHRNVAR